jgi:hypothetical protein
MQKTEIVYSYYSVEKLYCVLVWKIVLDQVPLDELMVLSKQLMEFSEKEASQMNIDVWFNENGSIVIYPDGDVVNIICFGQCENDKETLEKLKKSGKELKSFNDYGKNL